MNIFLEKFVDRKFKKPGKALDLGAGKFYDVACMRQQGWKCEGVDKRTGVNLERPYLSKHGPFDLVFSNYVIHKLKNKSQVIKTACNNLKSGGWLFIHTFDKSDKNSSSSITRMSLVQLLTHSGFHNIHTAVFRYFDNDPTHKHWHKILEAIAQRK